MLNGTSDEFRGCLWVTNIAGLMGQLADVGGVGGVQVVGFLDEGVEMGLVFGEAEVIYDDVGALFEEGEANCAADTGCSTGYDGGFAGKEILERHLGVEV